MQRSSKKCNGGTQWCSDQSLTTNTRWNTGTNVGKAQTHVHFQGHPQQEKLNCYHQTLLEDDEPDRWLFLLPNNKGMMPVNCCKSSGPRLQVINFWRERIIVFQVLWMAKFIVFLNSVSFSKPQINFQKIKMSRILLSIAVNFGCSLYRSTNE